jgi:carbonic anhydrase/acetyltransferase-like protein (isoleucine patch superfamily)
MPIYALHGVRPTLPADGRFWIAPNATLVGDVRLAEDASVWFGALLRGDNEPIVIGARSNVQDLCVMHTDAGFPLTIGEDCTIGHSAILHGCTIGDGALIGMGAVILNGAKIGRGSLVGARALITEGKEFPDHSLIVGSPARALRTLEAAAAEALRGSAAHYVENWRRFASGLEPEGGGG